MRCIYELKRPIGKTQEKMIQYSIFKGSLLQDASSFPRFLDNRFESPWTRSRAIPGAIRSGRV